MNKSLFYMLLIFVFSTFLGVFNVSASTYNSTNNLFENSYSNNLIDMANTQIDNFASKKFVILQVDYNYYLVVGEDYTFNGNSITFTNSTIFSAIRTNGSYGNYEYNKTTEGSTTINSNYLVISNTDFSKSISSKRFNEYWSEYYKVWLLAFIMGITFAIFVTKERRY